MRRFSNIPYLYWIGLCALLVAGGPVRAARAQADADLLDRYVRTALAQNLALQQEELDLATSLQALDEARGLFYPSLRLEARYTRSGGGRTLEFPVGDLLLAA
jgi:outer membrane protein TolC